MALKKGVLKRRRKKKAPQTSLSEMKQRFLAELDSSSDKDSLAVFGIARRFFQEYLRVKHSHTFEEMAEEIEKKRIEPEVKQMAVNLLTSLSELEFRPGISRKRTDKLREDLRAVIFALSHEARHAKKHLLIEKGRKGFILSRILISLLSRLLRSFSSLFRKMSPEQLETRSIIDKGFESLFSGDLTAAEGLYLSAISRYKTLLKDERESVYARLRALHESISRTKEMEAKLSHLLSRLEAGSSLPTSGRELLKEKYSEAVSLYSMLPEQLKQHYYDRLMHIRSRI